MYKFIVYSDIFSAQIAEMYATPSNVFNFFAKFKYFVVNCMWFYLLLGPAHKSIKLNLVFQDLFFGDKKYILPNW